MDGLLLSRWSILQCNRGSHGTLHVAVDACQKHQLFPVSFHFPLATHAQMVCGAGQYSPPEVNVCLPCPMGRYSGPKSAACTPCMFWAPFSFQGSTHLENCTCPAGYACFVESPPEQCPHGTFSAAGDMACMPCPDFTDSPAGADKCLSPCPGVQEFSGWYVTGLCVDACNPGAMRSQHVCMRCAGRDIP